MASEAVVEKRMTEAWDMASKLTPFATAAAILAQKIYDELKSEANDSPQGCSVPVIGGGKLIRK